MRRITTPTVARRHESDSSVSTLELFFDLVFVLALTQCTAFMSKDPTFTHIGEGLVLLALVWWSWVGYSWLTSVVDPERLSVRIPIFAAMGAFLVAALSIPDIEGDAVWYFVAAYTVVRAMQITLFALGARGDANLTRSIMALGTSTVVGLSILAAGATFDGSARFAVWAIAVALDMLGPFFFGAEGWHLVPGHFAERHGLILIIALGESIVALGVGAGLHIGPGVTLSAMLGIVVVSALWWVYFDVLAHAAEHQLAHTTEGRPQNEMARDGYSFLHFPMMAGIILVALGLKKTLDHPDDALKSAVAAALLGGASLYLLGRTAFGRRVMGAWSRDHFFVSVVLCALIPVAIRVPAVATLGMLAAVLTLQIFFKLRAFADRRAAVRARVFGT